MSPEARAQAAAPPGVPSRAAAVRSILGDLARIPGIRGGLLIASDGFVIASSLPAELAVDPLAALATTLGRELELGTSRLNRGMVTTAFFTADEGSLFLGPSPSASSCSSRSAAPTSAPSAASSGGRSTRCTSAWRAGDHTGARL